MCYQDHELGESFSRNKSGSMKFLLPVTQILSNNYHTGNQEERHLLDLRLVKSDRKKIKRIQGEKTQKSPVITF